MARYPLWTGLLFVVACGGSTEVDPDAPASVTAAQIAEAFCGLEARCGSWSRNCVDDRCMVQREDVDLDQCMRNYALEAELELEQRPLNDCEARWLTVCFQDMQAVQCLTEAEAQRLVDDGQSIGLEPSSCERIDDCEGR